MVQFVLFVAIGLGLGMFMAYRGWKADKTWWSFLAVGVGGICGLFLGLAVAGLSIFVIPGVKQDREYNKVELVAFDSLGKESGSFFLTSGTIEARQYYKYCFKTVGGSKRFGKVFAEKATVHEEERADAYMVRIGTIKQYSDAIYTWLIPKFLEGSSLGEYAIHVPKGAVKAE